MMEIRALLIALLVVLLILVFLRQLWSRRHYPPGPLLLPVIGSIWQVGIRLNEDTLIKIAKKYGNIYTLWLGYRPVIGVSGFQAVKEVLINHAEEFNERIESPFLSTIGRGRGIVMSSGHSWKQQRRFAVVTMRKLGLGKKVMEHQIEEEAQQLVETFACANGQPLDPSLAIINSVSNVISAMTFGYRFSLEDENFQKLIEAVDVGVQFLGSAFHGFCDIIPRIMNHLPGPHKKALAAFEVLLSHAREEIEKHKEQQSFHEPQDFIDFYLLQMEKTKDDPNSTFDEENLAHCIQDFFLAGTETTTTSLRWALILLTNHPAIQDKVYKEINDAFSSTSSICYQDIKKLPYTSAVIHEILRSKYVFLYGGSRQCTKDVKVNGYLVPKGAHVLPDLRSVLLDPERWETPEEFNPNHFLDKDGHFVAREEFVAFGEGPRACPGEQLARMELFIFLSSLLRTFRFQLPEGVKELSLHAKTGLMVSPKPYKICAVPHCSSP